MIAFVKRRVREADLEHPPRAAEFDFVGLSADECELLPRTLSTVSFQFLTIDAPKQWILPRRPSLVTKTCLVARRVPFAVLPRRVVTSGPSHAASLVLPLPSRWATKIIGVARRVSRRGPLAASQTRALRVAITATPVGGEFVFAGTSGLKTARRLIGVTFFQSRRMRLLLVLQRRQPPRSRQS